MIRVSDAYKKAMAAHLREPSYLKISIGVINQDAQDALSIEGEIDDEYAWWSDLEAPLSEAYKLAIDYATLEQNFLKCDGSQRFLPSKETWNHNGAYCVISKEPMGSIKFALSGSFAVKGITIDFTENYPTSFKIVSNEGEHTYTNNSQTFNTDDAVGLNTEWFKIVPLTMKGGTQRLRIKSMLMGLGLYLTGDVLSNVTLSEYCSPISENLPNTKLSISVIDYDDNYNVDNPDALINYLLTKQQVDVTAGITLEDGEIEYVQLGSLWLTSWESAYGKMSFSATDKLEFFNKYNNGTFTPARGYVIQSRSIYADCVEILEDLGLDEDEYIVDEYLKTKTIVNPLPDAAHSALLQLLANAGRCIIFQDNVGRVCIKVNFPYSLTDNDYSLASNTNAPWGSLDHILDNSVSKYYADFTQDFSIVNGSMYVLPESPPYLDGTSYVSTDVANSMGAYTTNPALTMNVVAGFDFSELHINFAGNVPDEITVHTSWAGTSNPDIVFTDLELENIIEYEFGTFDSITIEVTKGAPNSRTLITYLRLGMGSNYRLHGYEMLEHPMGKSDETVANVKVRIITYEEVGGKPQQVNDEVYYTCNIADKGIDVVFENPLISTQAMAQEVAEWLGNYYKNNITYDVKYRGEPRLNAGDYIKMDNDYNDDLTVEIIEDNLTYNGAFGGNLKLRRSLKEL